MVQKTFRLLSFMLFGRDEEGGTAFQNWQPSIWTCCLDPPKKPKKNNTVIDCILTCSYQQCHPGHRNQHSRGQWTETSVTDKSFFHFIELTVRTKDSLVRTEPNSFRPPWTHKSTPTPEAQTSNQGHNGLYLLPFEIQFFVRLAMKECEINHIFWSLHALKSW